MSLPFDGAISEFFRSEAPDQIREAIRDAKKDSVLDPSFPYRDRMDKGDYEDQLEAILRRGQEAGVFALADAKIATLAVIAMLTGVNTWFREGGRLSLDEVEGIYWNMVRKAVSA